MRFASFLVVLGLVQLGAGCRDDEKPPAKAERTRDEQARRALERLERGRETAMQAAREAQVVADEAAAEAKQQAAEAERARDEAMAAAQQAAEAVERAEKQLVESTAQIQSAIDAVAEARNDAERAAAKARLTELQRGRAELQARIAAAKASTERAKRLQAPADP